MREIKRIVVNCTGTPPFTPVVNIQKYWREKLGWKNSGYHYIITSNGEVVQLADEKAICNGAEGFNHDSIHVAYDELHLSLKSNVSRSPVSNEEIAKEVFS